MLWFPGVQPTPPFFPLVCLHWLITLILPTVVATSSELSISVSRPDSSSNVRLVCVQIPTWYFCSTFAFCFRHCAECSACLVLISFQPFEGGMRMAYYCITVWVWFKYYYLLWNWDNWHSERLSCQGYRVNRLGPEFTVSPSQNISYPLGNWNEEDGSEWIIGKIEEFSKGPEKANEDCPLIRGR